MTSSQALTQSVFGNLTAYDSVHSLCGLLDDQGFPLFDTAELSAGNLSMEHPLTLLNDPVPASIDVFIPGSYQIAVECTLTEQDVGNCSSVGRHFCDGSYVPQMGRRERCYFTSTGVRYWEYIPRLFSWTGDVDHKPCPLYSTYQLVRRILAACIGPDGKFSHKKGHALLIYDDRNPEFQDGGNGLKTYQRARAALLYPTLLMKCSWQRLIGHLRSRSVLPWLTAELKAKYGL